MKSYLTLFGFIALFFVGFQTSIAQEDPQTEALKKQTILDHQNAKDQTFALHRVVNLSGEQVSKVNEMFLTIEKKQRLIDETVDKKDLKLKLDNLQAFKKDSLEEILTESQYSVYLKSIQ